MNDTLQRSGLARAVTRRGWIVRALLFLCLFWALQSGWELARGSALERWVLHDATVATAARIIDALTPAVAVEPVGASLRARGGGLRIQRGCEGVEALFLLVAALLAAPLRWSQCAAGMLFGTALVYCANEIRIVLLFYCWRVGPSLFAAMHGAVLPLLLVVAVGLFFHIWIARHAGRDAET